MKPNTTQLIALHAFAAKHGRNWKSALNNAWMTGAYQSDDNVPGLQQVRNVYGPSWLTGFRLPPIQIFFESGANYISAKIDDSDILIRCNFSYTDCGEDESLDSFIRRHGGPHGTTEYLREAYRNRP